MFLFCFILSMFFLFVRPFYFPVGWKPERRWDFFYKIELNYILNFVVKSVNLLVISNRKSIWNISIEYILEIPTFWTSLSIESINFLYIEIKSIGSQVAHETRILLSFTRTSVWSTVHFYHIYFPYLNQLCVKFDKYFTPTITSNITHTHSWRQTTLVVSQS